MLKDKIEQDLIEAMKAHNEAVVSVLRMLKSAVKNQEIQKQTELKDEDLVSVIQGQVKQRQDSIALYEQGGRTELADKEKAEIEILIKYLPEQMSEKEIRELVKKAITSTGAASIQDMGKVMGALMPQVKGKADGGLVSKIVQEELKN
jgi:uncharacterized protein YqeY